MSGLQKDVCKHGVTFYPGKFEKEQCCKYCKRLGESGLSMLPIEPEKCSQPTVVELMHHAETSGGVFSQLKSLGWVNEWDGGKR